jgi:uncharacterized integral membrane protein
MFVLGLILLAAAVVAAVELILANHGPFTFHMWSWTWHFDAFWLAVIGAIVITAAWLGLVAMQMGFARGARLRRERRRLAAENEMLARRAAAGTAPRTGTTDNRRSGTAMPAATSGATAAPAEERAPTPTSGAVASEEHVGTRRR